MNDISLEELNDNQVYFYMKKAINKAENALASLEVPIGCVIVKDGEIIVETFNKTNQERNGTRHAEMLAIEELMAKYNKSNFSDCYIFVTCEPCVMCATALSYIKIGRGYYGCKNDRFGGCDSLISINRVFNGSKCYTKSNSKWNYSMKGGYFADECMNLLKEFYKHGNPNAPCPAKLLLMDY